MIKNIDKKYLILAGLAVILIIGLGLAVWQLKSSDQTLSPTKDKVAVDDVSDYTNSGSDYTITLAPGWVPQELYSNVTAFLKNSKDKANNAEGTMIIGITTLAEAEGATTTDAWLAVNGLSRIVPQEGITINEENINGRPMLRILQADPSSSLNVLHYIYFTSDAGVISISHSPYLEGSPATLEFEDMVKTFTTQR